MTVSNELTDSLLADYKKPEDLIGENGLLKQLTKRRMERALQAEWCSTWDTLFRRRIGKSKWLLSAPLATHIDKSIHLIHRFCIQSNQSVIVVTFGHHVPYRA